MKYDKLILHKHQGFQEEEDARPVRESSSISQETEQLHSGDTTTIQNNHSQRQMELTDIYFLQ